MAKPRKGFSRDERILKRTDFIRLQSSGQKIHSRNFVFVIGPRESPPSRLGIVVSTRVDSRAVKRNRVKRLIRECFREMKSGLLSHFDLVVIAKQTSIQCEVVHVRKEMERALSGAALWRAEE